HTNDPGLAIQKALTYGSLTRMKIDNMREEHHERVIKNASEMAKQQKQEEKKVEFKENGFISVSVGDGLTDLFHELGVDEVIEGGQTMNPSTEDILGAIEKIPAKNIYILPNNGNIILAAQQAKDLTKDKAVHVIPTKNIPQGIAAMINFVEGFTPEQNEEAMTEALSEVKSGQVTYAVRDTVIDGKEIKAGNIMGLSDKTIEIVGTDVVDTTIDLLKKMMDEESELITIYYGEEGTKEDAEKIAKAIEGIDDEMEVEIQYGGQPIYYYFVSVE
ncbi:MAG TPA: dihydroxyacetone kinase, partial [Lachnospiraceae bacterium]|nr:dihydroxyacetone kinase [Lachnospiraceae bacterium]